MCPPPPRQEWFAAYVELNQQIGALLGGADDDDEEEAGELKALQRQLSDVCYQQAAQLESRQNVLQAAHAFHAATQEVSWPPDAELGSSPSWLRLAAAFYFCSE